MGETMNTSYAGLKIKLEDTCFQSEQLKKTGMNDYFYGMIYL